MVAPPTSAGARLRAGVTSASPSPSVSQLTRSFRMADSPHSVRDILDRLNDRAERSEAVSIGAMVETFGSRSYGPFLLVPPLIEFSPIGGIPGAPTLLAAAIILFAGQMAFGRKHLWLPQIVAKRSVSAGRLSRAVEKIRPFGRWLDRHFHGRLERLTTDSAIRIAAVACIALALAVPPLELVPFASSAPMLPIAMLGLALLVHDGALMIAAAVLAVAAVGAAFWLLGSGG